MIRAIAKWYARVNYLFTLEVEAAKNDLNAGTAFRNAEEKRKLVAQLNSEADAIDKNIEAESAKLEEGYWECDNGHENDDSLHNRDGKLGYFCLSCKSPAKLLKLSEMTGQEKYELEKQKGEAQKIAAEKRTLAKQEQENVDTAVQAVKMLSGRAQDSRAFADKIRAL